MCAGCAYVFESASQCDVMYTGCFVSRMARTIYLVNIG